jgi:pimeloyl-ACP methyl ester carboxylesterase
MDLEIGGRQVFAATGGRSFDPGLPGVVLVHGAGMDHTVWTLQARYLAHHGRGVLAVDLPGHGRSAGPALPSIGDVADWLATLIDAAGLERAALVGHSMGALACLACAAEHPDRVRALALLGAAPSMPVHPDLLAAAAAGDAKAYEMICDWGHGPTGHMGGHRAPGLWLMGGGLRLLERGAEGVLHTDLAACATYTDGADAAARVRCPTLVLCGGADRMTPARGGAKLAELIPSARSTVIAGAGHMMMLEDPEATLSALKETV